MVIHIHINILKFLGGIYKVWIHNYMYSFFRFSQWPLDHETSYINSSINSFPGKVVIAMEFSLFWLSIRNQTEIINDKDISPWRIIFV